MAHTYTVLYGYSIAHYRILRICINSITVRTRTAVLMPTSAVPPVSCRHDGGVVLGSGPYRCL